MELTVAITGASGTIYAHRTLQLLAASGVVEKINLIMSSTAATVRKAVLNGVFNGTRSMASVMSVIFMGGCRQEWGRACAGCW